MPDLLQPLLPHVGEGEVFEVAGLGAGQHVAVWRDSDVNGAPAVHAGLGTTFVIVGDDEEDGQAITEPLACLAHLIFGFLQFGMGRHQRVAVEQRPVVVLHVRQLEVLDSQFDGELDDVRHLSDVLPGDWYVEHHGVVH